MTAVPAPVLVTDRLELATMTAPVLAALVGHDLDAVAAYYDAVVPPGWMDGHDDVAGLWLARVRERPEEAGYLARAMLRTAAPRTVVGHCGFHLPPDDRAMVEIGYTVEPAFRRQGFAEEAVRALARAAFAAGAKVLRASVAPDNAASLALVEKLGLDRVGTQWDDVDGEEHVFEVGLPLGA